MSGHHHHDHGHGGHCHDEGHDHSNDITPALQSLLYSQIQFDMVSTLNGKLSLINIVTSGRWSTDIEKYLQNLFLALAPQFFKSRGLKD